MTTIEMIDLIRAGRSAMSRRALVEKVGGKHYRTYRTYRYDLKKNS